jgi:hypothetical protein
VPEPAGYPPARAWNEKDMNLRRVFAIFVVIQIVGWLFLLALQFGIDGIVH